MISHDMSKSIMTYPLPIIVTNKNPRPLLPPLCALIVWISYDFWATEITNAQKIVFHIQALSRSEQNAQSDSDAAAEDAEENQDQVESEAESESEKAEAESSQVGEDAQSESDAAAQDAEQNSDQVESQAQAGSENAQEEMNSKCNPSRDQSVGFEVALDIVLDKRKQFA